MPSTTTTASSPPPRSPPSSIGELIQRSPLLAQKAADSRQQRSGSIRPSSPPQRSPTPQQTPLDQITENGSQKSEPINMETFDQILELDEDGEPYDFAWEMAEAYFDQAETTLKEMEAAIANKDLKTLSSLGHFLKGSSATLGITRVQSSCESIQHYGNSRDDKTGKVIPPDIALSRISISLKEAKEEYREAEVWLRKWHSDVEARCRKTKGDKND